MAEPDDSSRPSTSKKNQASSWDDIFKKNRPAAVTAPSTTKKIQKRE